MLVEERIIALNRDLSGGVIPAMATPLHLQTGDVNYEIVPALVDFLLERGVRGLFVGGTTGEGLFLPSDQRQRLHETAIKAAAGRAPVLVHVGALQSKAAIELAQHAAASGADGIVSMTPIFYGMSDEALAAYFRTVAEAAPETPLFAYDIPHMAVNGVSAQLANRLFTDIPSMAGMKSSHRDAQAIRRLADVIPGDRVLLVGNEAIALGSLALGAHGMISGTATAVPEPLVAMVNAYFIGDLLEARRQQQIVNRILALIPADRRIGSMKAILEERGIAVGRPTPPIPAMDEPLWQAMAEILAE